MATGNIHIGTMAGNMKTDDFESFRALVDQLEPDDREEVLQMYKKAYHYLKTGNPNIPSLE